MKSKFTLLVECVKNHYFKFYANLVIDENSELFVDKMVRHCKEQPLVPLGCLLTTGALLLSGRSIRQGDFKGANRMFVWRVALQGFTLVALVGGSYYMGINERWKVDRDEELRKKAAVREKMWIEELERIDQAAKERQQMAEKIRLSKSKLSEESQNGTKE